jgi:hypothetical protein
MLWIHIGVKAAPDPAFIRSMRIWIQFRIRFQGVDDRLSKLVNFYSKKKQNKNFCPWPSWRTSKTTYGRNFNPRKRTSSTSVCETSFTFLGHFCPGSGSKSSPPKSMRIRIHNTASNPTIPPLQSFPAVLPTITIVIRTVVLEAFY